MLRVLYGYLMACSAHDIPSLEFPRDEIIEIIPASYNNNSKHIHIPELPRKLVPGSPEDIKIPVPTPSGSISPANIGTPARSGSPDAAEKEKTVQREKEVRATGTGLLPLRGGPSQGASGAGGNVSSRS